MKKRLMSLVVMFILVSAIFVAAQEDIGNNSPQSKEDQCAGFWGKISCFLFGTGEKETALVGKAGGIWGEEGEALVGAAAAPSPAEPVKVKVDPNEGSVYTIFANAGYIEKDENHEARKEWYEKNYLGETYTGTENQNKKMLNDLKSRTKVVYKKGEAPPAPEETPPPAEKTTVERLNEQIEADKQMIEISTKTIAKLKGKAEAARAAAKEAETEERKKEKEAEAEKLEAEIKKEEEDLKLAKEQKEEFEKDLANARWGGSAFNELEKTTVGKWLLTGDNPLGYVAGPALAFIQGLGKYRALSNLLIPDATQKWLGVTNSAFFRYMDVVGALTKEVCDYDDKMTADIPGQNAVFIESAGGSYQFVGRIQAERSSSPTIILCDPVNKTCPNDFICKDDLCYEEDGEEPVKGYLYKVEWGVTAPSDEKFTPYIDEDGKAVKLNVMINYKGKEVWLYKRTGAARKEVIELKNGESDTSMWLKYLGGTADKACIMFSDSYYPTDRYERHEIKKICADIKPIVKGEVEYGTTSPSQKVSTGDVTEATDIW